MGSIGFSDNVSRSIYQSAFVADQADPFPQVNLRPAPAYATSACRRQLLAEVARIGTENLLGMNAVVAVDREARRGSKADFHAEGRPHFG